MGDKSWKRFEREVAKFFGTERNPLSSRHSKHDTESDTLHKFFYIEAKRDKKCLGEKLKSILYDTLKCAKKEKKCPVVALKDQNKKGFWIIVHSDFIRVDIDNLLTYPNPRREK